MAQVVCVEAGEVRGWAMAVVEVGLAVRCGVELGVSKGVRCDLCAGGAGGRERVADGAALFCESPV
jgi:hypothetical protein